MQPDETTPADTPAPETSESSWAYNPDQADHHDTPLPSTTSVEWTASEFVQHDKDASWYVALGVLGVVVSGVLYLLTRDRTTVGVVIIALILFAVAAKRKPRTLHYQIDSHGVTMGTKLYPFAQFKSFTVLQEGAFNSIQLMSLKRFMPPISLYCPPEQEEAVIATLGNYLPHETRNHDPVDRLMSKIRF